MSYPGIQIAWDKRGKRGFSELGLHAFNSVRSTVGSSGGCVLVELNSTCVLAVAEEDDLDSQVISVATTVRRRESEQGGNHILILSSKSVADKVGGSVGVLNNEAFVFAGLDAPLLLPDGCALAAAGAFVVVVDGQGSLLRREPRLQPAACGGCA
jgi:hypothetical protein